MRYQPPMVIPSELFDRVAGHKADLDSLRPLESDALVHLQKHYDVELTFTSNAIEGTHLPIAKPRR